MMNKTNFLNSCSVLFPMFLHLVILSHSSASQSYGNKSDLMALLDLKNLITEDQKGTMNLWNQSVHFCNWFGITCTPRNQRVMILSLENQGLVGSLPLSIGNLTQLTHLNLSNNEFRGEIPREIGRLVNLRHISLSYNSFGGKIPANISGCKELRTLSLSRNQLVGTIPDQLRSLTKLTFFGIGANKHTGKIPAWIGNFSSLTVLSLAVNNLQGVIPTELGLLTNLQMFLLWDNNLSGVFPHSIFNISSIFYFTVAKNRLEGELPKDIGLTLPKLEVFACGANRFTGHVPESFSNASRIQLIDISENGLSGALPLSIGRLRDLSYFDVSGNGLGSGLKIVTLLVNCTGLKVLDLSMNFFGGEFPKSTANLSTQLTILLMGSTMIYGGIPKGIGNLVNLTSLGLEGNSLSGNIPVELGKLNKLNALHLNVNMFSGSVPSSLSNLTSLIRVFMEENRLDGFIPLSLGSLRKLLVLNLSSNNLNGSIPREIMEISSLSISLTLSNNSLTGSLPSEVGKLSNLLELDVSRNELTGEIPSSLGDCLSLSTLRLEDNEFEGEIPESLKSLRGLEYLDLSNNDFSGHVPEFFTEFPFLKHLDISRNDFEGKLSKEGIFSNASAVSVLGNDRLCGGVIELHLPECPHQRENKHSWRNIFSRKVLIPLVSAASVITILASLFCFYNLCRESKNSSTSTPVVEEQSFHISYFELAESTNGFATENLIGSGSFGSVYKGVLGVDRKMVAVKVLNLHIRGALKSFFKECSALRSVRHRNLLKIITACSSIDHRGNDFKSLVFEYMANGNLDEWLHRKNGERNGIKWLNFVQRINIAIDVASALDYLHNRTETPIVHCDLKPSNVLLDHEMVAHVGDFGLASFLFEASENVPKSQTISVQLKGSTGYIPPEYGMGGKVSVLGDSYSYGILLLEMFTGKRPTDDFFEENLSIHQFVSRAFPDRIMEIVDSSLLLFEEYESERNESDIEEQVILEAKRNNVNGDKRIEEFLVSIMRIGLLCSNGSPMERLRMSDVLNKMFAIRDSYLKSNNTKQK